MSVWATSRFLRLCSISYRIYCDVYSTFEFLYSNKQDTYGVNHNNTKMKCNKISKYQCFIATDVAFGNQNILTFNVHIVGNNKIVDMRKRSFSHPLFRYENIRLYIFVVIGINGPCDEKQWGCHCGTFSVMQVPCLLPKKYSLSHKNNTYCGTMIFKGYLRWGLW